jgi:hypothetical protein
MRRPLSFVSLLAATVAMLGGLSAPAAGASAARTSVTGASVAAPSVHRHHHKPSAKFGFADVTITAGVRPRITFSTKHVTKKEKIEVQRTAGTQHEFERVKVLKTHSGTVNVRKVAMGRYAYRIVVLKGKTVKATSKLHNLFSYGTVTALQLCDRDQDADFDSGCGEDTVQVGSSVYTYAVEADEGDDGPDQDADVSVQHSSCRSATLSFAVSNDETDVTSVGAELTQSAADSQSASTGFGSIGHLTASIRSSAWDLVLFNDDENRVFWNGTFSCWSSSGEA